MTTRPEFNAQLSSQTFSKFYWYKTELQQICRHYALPTYGTKAELTQYIYAFLDGTPPSAIHSVRHYRTKIKTALTTEQISLNTKLLHSGFALNNEARQFFANYFGVSHFSFRKSMAVKMREVARTNDTNTTVSDLIQALQAPSINTFTEQTYQWNHFVKDFCADPWSQNYKQSLKAAAILWRIVRDSDQPKVYQHELLVRYASSLKKFLK
ncbi:SAP domain-containing protein [Bombilactobacillus folatiphilus]|uniref:SAP domain-containing protein n=1 Tax=Bombilactobacillus folatiphilus TaxID=2923362 RepID=A0ABY4P8E0_9LACO|nr:SAP domain-containing protein [Bombilactobacillus folatiphilus]UQS81781.1 SAP domain-containing protein [Bombilactobacillus folatiphilus]